MNKKDDALQLEYIARSIANDIADQFTAGFCDDKMVKGFAKIVKNHINTLKLEQENKDNALRDHFAGLAMQGLLANQILLEKGAKQHSSVNSIFQSYAKDAVDIADSLIAELNEDVTTP